MTEKQLIKAGFKKEEVSAEEAGTDKGFYYYTLEIGDIELISNPNDQLVNGQWACYFLNSNEIEIIYEFHLRLLISVLKYSLKNGEQNEGNL